MQSDKKEHKITMWIMDRDKNHPYPLFETENCKKDIDEIIKFFELQPARIIHCISCENDLFNIETKGLSEKYK